ncbi:MAG: hypothetical protein WCI92_13820 [Bacteroidota bacterium]
MIHKKATVGIVQNVFVIDLGANDVKIGIVNNKEVKKVGLDFSNADYNSLKLGSSTDQSKPQAMILFSSEKSIDTLIAILKQAKVLLTHIKNVK